MACIFRASFSNHEKKEATKSKRSPEGLPSRYLNTLTVYFSQTCTKCRPQASLRASGTSKGHSRELPRGSPKSIFEDPYGVYFHKLARSAGRRPVCEPQGPPKVTPEFPTSRPGAPQEVPKGSQGALGAPGILQNPCKSMTIHENH